MNSIYYREELIMTEKERDSRIAVLNHKMNQQGQDLRDYYTATKKHWKETQLRISQELQMAEVLGLAEVGALAAYMGNKMMLAGFEAGLDEPFETDPKMEAQLEEVRQKFLAKIEEIKNGE